MLFYNEGSGILPRPSCELGKRRDFCLLAAAYGGAGTSMYPAVVTISSYRHLADIRCRAIRFIASAGMRILMISDVYFPRINGVSTSIQTFRRGLHAAGHETVLIAPQYPAGDAGQEGRIIRVPSRYLPRDPEDRIMKAGELRALRPELRKSGFDLVHIQTPFLAHYHGVSIARQLGVPVIETYHTYFEEYLHHYVPLIPR